MAESSIWIPPLGVAIRLAAIALREIGGDRPWHEGSELPPRGVLWVGRAIRPDPDALRMPRDEAHAGLPEGSDAALVSRSLFLDPQERAMPGDGCRGVSADSLRVSPTVWAIEQAIRHQAFAAIVADGRGMSMADSRRLQVAMSARSLPMLVLLLREPREAGVRSVASFRWRVESCVRPAADEPEGAWCLRLVRGRTGLPVDARRRIEGDGGLATLVEVDPWRGRRCVGDGNPAPYGAGLPSRSSRGAGRPLGRSDPAGVMVPGRGERSCAG